MPAEKMDFQSAFAKYVEENPGVVSHDADVVADVIMSVEQMSLNIEATGRGIENIQATYESWKQMIAVALIILD